LPNINKTAGKGGRFMSTPICVVVFDGKPEVLNWKKRTSYKTTK
jgi:hypothetical protein